jgi:ribosome-binding factor A
LTLKKAKLLHLGRKNKQVYFVLLSIIRNFAARKERLIMQETRQAKISRLLQKELAQIFQSQTRMMHGVMVSVTRVKISPDLSICTAHLSVFPSEKAEEILNNVNANVKTIRYDLGQRIRNQVRIIPELRFFIDDSLDYIDHIDELLKK